MNTRCFVVDLLQCSKATWSSCVVDLLLEQHGAHVSSTCFWSNMVIRRSREKGDATSIAHTHTHTTTFRHPAGTEVEHLDLEHPTHVTHEFQSPQCPKSLTQRTKSSPLATTKPDKGRRLCVAHRALRLQNQLIPTLPDFPVTCFFHLGVPGAMGRTRVVRHSGALRRCGTV